MGPVFLYYALSAFVHTDHPNNAKAEKRIQNHLWVAGKTGQIFQLCFSLLSAVSKMAHLGSHRIPERDVCSDLLVLSWTMMSISVESSAALDVSSIDIVTA